MLGVQKSRPARPALLNARASVEMTDATRRTRSSSKAAERRMGLAKDVDEEKGPVRAKATPGE
jgi:hypothetical protein